MKLDFSNRACKSNIYPLSIIDDKTSIRILPYTSKNTKVVIQNRPDSQYFGNASPQESIFSAPL